MPKKPGKPDTIKEMPKKPSKQKPKGFTPSPETEKITKKYFAKGGTASKRADGCAQRGKTKGKMV